MPGVQINLPSFRFNFGVVRVLKYGTGVGATATGAAWATELSAETGAAVTVRENVCVALPEAFVAVIV